MHAAAVGRADDHGNAEVAVTAVADPGSFLHDLLETRKDEVGELHLRHGAEVVDSKTDRDTSDQALVERRVDDAFLAELGDEAHRDPEHPATSPNVFTEHHDAVV